MNVLSRATRHLERSAAGLALLTLLAALLFVGALVGLGWVAGFGAVEARLDRVDWPWLGASLAGMLLAFGGYRLAYEGIAKVGGGPRLSRAERSAIVVAGFGGFVARGGSALDKRAMEAAGADERDAKVRVAALDSLEHVPIALGGCAAGIALLVSGLSKHPPADFVLPWAVIPPLGAVLALWAARRYRDEWRDAAGWRGLLAIGFDGIWMIIDLLRERTAHGLPYLGMCVFWIGDVFALWAALAAFGFRMAVAPLVIAYAIGYALTRRSAPLGGAGMIETFLPLTLWDSGAPLAAAVAGVLAYRVFNLWVPLPAAFAVLPRLRRIGEDGHADDVDAAAGEPLLDRLFSWLRRPHLEHGRREVMISVAVAGGLALGALVAVGWLAGYGKLGPLFRTADWVWFPVALAGEAVAYVGYTLAYREFARMERGRSLPLPRLLALVASGFGLFIPRGGFAADYRVLVDQGFEPRQARLRVLGIGAFEYAILAPAASAAAIILLVRGTPVRWSLTLPWAIAVPIGFALAVALLPRREEWHRRGGWRGVLAHGLDVVYLLRVLAARPRQHGIAAGLGMTLYWAGDIFCLWACLRGFLGHPPSLPALLLGYATGYALTRRTLPFAGAGAVEILLPLVLLWVRFPLAVALLAVVAYRVFNLWLPLVPALAGMRTLRNGRADAGAADEPIGRDLAAGEEGAREPVGEDTPGRSGISART